MDINPETWMEFDCPGKREFHKHLIKQNTEIHFTKETEENSKIPFLDCLVTRVKQLLMHHCLQKTNTPWWTAWPNILLSQQNQSNH